MYLGSGGIVPQILDLGTRWRRVVSFTAQSRQVFSFTAQSLYPWGKNPWYSLDRRLGGTQWQEGKNPSPCWELNSGLSAHSLSLAPLVEMQNKIFWNSHVFYYFTHLIPFISLNNQQLTDQLTSLSRFHL